MTDVQAVEVLEKSASEAQLEELGLKPYHVVPLASWIPLSWAILFGVLAALLAFSVAGTIAFAWGPVGAPGTLSPHTAGLGSFFASAAPILIVLGIAGAAALLVASAAGLFTSPLLAQWGPIAAGLLFLAGGAGVALAYDLNIGTLAPIALCAFAAAFAFDARPFTLGWSRGLTILLGLLTAAALALTLVWLQPVPGRTSFVMFNPRDFLGVRINAPQLLVLHAALVLPLLSASRTVIEILRKGLAVLAVIAPVLFVLGWPRFVFEGVAAQQLLAFDLGVVAALTFLSWDLNGRKVDRPRQFSVVFGVIALVTSLFVMVAYTPLIQSFTTSWFTGGPTRVLIGILLVIFVTEGVRRTLGLAVALIAFAHLAYDLWGHLIDWSFAPPAAIDRQWDWVFWYMGVDSNAILGDTLLVGVVIIVPFVLFGKMLSLAGGAEFFKNLAVIGFGRYRGGAGKITVVGSAMFGMVSGSAVANVAAVGSVTIPLMKRTGFSGVIAGGVESAGSVGGQLMPPMMGATAFLMLTILELSYGELVIAVLVPIILYYAALFISIDLYAARRGLKGVPRPPFWPEFRAGWHFLLPILTFFFAILGLGQQPQVAALWAIAVLLIAVTIFGYHGRRLTPYMLWRSVVETGEAVVEIVMVCAAAGIMVGALFHTGAISSIGGELVELAGNNLFLLLVIAAVLSIILGLGMPSVSVYVLLAFLIAPAIVQAAAPIFGIDYLEATRVTAEGGEDALKQVRIGAHMFVQYFGLMSMITPPVAVASLAASIIARTGFWATSWAAMGLGWTAYIVPFLFVYNPEMLLGGNFLVGMALFAATLAGISFISFAGFGYARGKLTAVERVTCAIVGVMLMVPLNVFPGSDGIKIVGAVLAVGLVVKFFYLDRHKHRASGPATLVEDDTPEPAPVPSGSP